MDDKEEKVMAVKVEDRKLEDAVMEVKNANIKGKKCCDGGKKCKYKR